MAFLLTQKVTVRAAIYILPIPTISLYALCLTGCVSDSPGVANIALVKIASTGAGQRSALRLGYFGICDDASCVVTWGKSAQDIATRFQGRSNFAADTGLIAFGLDLQRKILISPLVVSGVLFFSGVVAVGLNLWDSKKKIEKSNSFAGGGDRAGATQWFQLFALGFCWLATSLAFTTAFSITEATNSLQFMSNLEADGVSVISGLILQRLHWAIFALALVFSVGLTSLLKGRPPMRMRPGGPAVGGPHGGGGGARPGGYGGGGFEGRARGAGIPPPPPPPMRAR